MREKGKERKSQAPARYESKEPIGKQEEDKKKKNKHTSNQKQKGLLRAGLEVRGGAEVPSQ